MLRQRLFRAEEGFTLIEVMVVVLVVGILIAIGLPMFMGAKVRAEERGAQGVLRTAQTAGLAYWTQGGTFTALDANCTGVSHSCDIAEAEDGSVAWMGPGAPAARQVSIVLAAGNTLLVATRSKSGEYFCIVQATGETERGRGAAFGDVDTVPECAGGW